MRAIVTKLGRRNRSFQFFKKKSSMAAPSLACALAIAILQVRGAATCTSEGDCSYNGECQAGTCICDRAWRGARCATLNLLPATRGAGLNASDSGGPISSWGGTVTKGQRHVLVCPEHH